MKNMSAQKGKNKNKKTNSPYCWTCTTTYANYTNHLVKALNEVHERREYDVRFQSYCDLSIIFACNRTKSL